MKYLLDANVLIEAYRTYYAFEFVPAFWDWLSSMNRAGDVYSVPAVKREIVGDDPLSTWAHVQRPEFWIAESPRTVSSLRECVEWAAGRDHYTDAALAEFERSADLRLIAEAKASNLAVVTRELTEPNRKSRVKIPDACAALGVPYITPFGMFRALGWRLEVNPEDYGQLGFKV